MGVVMCIFGTVQGATIVWYIVRKAVRLEYYFYTFVMTQLTPNQDQERETHGDT